MDFHRIFDRFRSGRSRNRGVRRASPRPRDSRTDTEFVHTGPPSYPPLAPSHPPVPPVAPPPVAPPLPEPVVPRAAPAQPAQPASDAGATRILSLPVSAQGAVAAVLICIEGKLEGEVYKVRDGENRLGRAPGAEIRLDDRDETVSREHALIIHRDGAFGIKPLKTDNPTFVNGEEVEGGASLSDGDQIRVGRSTFRFRVA
ncbi:MAG TPA: FHA domain-containing protein [Myxococcota bacterium]|nr:FHA domain-containing protein [Myxococcota bacterium]